MALSPVQMDAEAAEYRELQADAEAQARLRRSLTHALSLATKAATGTADDLEAIRHLVEFERQAIAKAEEASKALNDRFPPHEGRFR